MDKIVWGQTKRKVKRRLKCHINWFKLMSRLVNIFSDAKNSWRKPIPQMWIIQQLSQCLISWINCHFIQSLFQIVLQQNLWGPNLHYMHWIDHSKEKVCKQGYDIKWYYSTISTIVFLPFFQSKAIILFLLKWKPDMFEKVLCSLWTLH